MKILLKRLDGGLKFDVILTEFVGVNATHRHLAGELPPTSKKREDVESLRRVPADPDGPPEVVGFAGGRPNVDEIIAYFPALIPKNMIETKIEIVEARDVT